MTRLIARALAGSILCLAILGPGAATADPVAEVAGSTADTVYIPAPPPGPGGYLCPVLEFDGDNYEVCVPAP